MVPVQRLALKEYNGKNGKDNQRNNLLYNLQLHEAERAAVLAETQPVGRYLTAILKQCYSPTEQYHTIERPVADDLHLLQFQMAIPSQSHKNIGYDKQSYRIQSLHFFSSFQKSGAKIRIKNKKQSKSGKKVNRGLKSPMQL